MWLGPFFCFQSTHSLTHHQIPQANNTKPTLRNSKERICLLSVGHTYVCVCIKKRISFVTIRSQEGKTQRVTRASVKRLTLPAALSPVFLSSVFNVYKNVSAVCVIRSKIRVTPAFPKHNNNKHRKPVCITFRRLCLIPSAHVVVMVVV